MSILTPRSRSIRPLQTRQRWSPRWGWREHRSRHRTAAWHDAEHMIRARPSTTCPPARGVTDTFAYSIVDVGGAGAIAGFADGGAGTTIVSAPSHRLAAGLMVTISGAGPLAYTARAPLPRWMPIFPHLRRLRGNPPVLERAAGRRWKSARRARVMEALVQVSVLGRNDPLGPRWRTSLRPVKKRCRASQAIPAAPWRSIPMRSIRQPRQFAPSASRCRARPAARPSGSPSR